MNEMKTAKTKKQVYSTSLGTRMRKSWQLYMFMLPAIITLGIFHYAPMYGLIGAFQDLKPRLGYFKSRWVGLDHFERFFTSHAFGTIVPNTIILSLYNLLASMPFAILLAICLNYITNLKFKKLVQNVTYAPHFISTVVLTSIITAFFGYNDGLVNGVMELMGLDRFFFLADENAFRHLYVWSGVWQNVGWSSVIYVAALAGVDPALHESAIIDGASIVQRIRYIDIPTITPTIVTLLVLNAGKVMTLGFDKAFLMQNTLNTGASEIISTYVYKMGLVEAQYGYSAAVGIFNSVVNAILLITVNWISKKINDTSIF